MFSTKDHEFMNEALLEAKKALEKGEVPVGAVIVFNDKIIGRGHNLVSSTNDISKHAEMIAIKEAEENVGNWRLNDATIYVTLEPCYMCSGAIYLARIKRIVYALDNQELNIYGNTNDLFLSNGLAYYPIIESGLEKERSLELLNEHFKKLRK